MKEFRQIFRNRSILPLIFIMPVIQLLVMPMAADYEIRNINIAVVDHDQSSFSKELIRKITSSGYFRLQGIDDNYNIAFRHIEHDEADLILELPRGLEKSLVLNNHSKVLIASNAINGVKANLGSQYLSAILSNFSKELRDRVLPEGKVPEIPTIEIEGINWYNTYLDYHKFMVPGILVSLVTMVGVYMCSLNIVREKETGTIEQINVTPIGKVSFILGKLIPFWIIGVFIFTVGLFGVARLAYGIIPAGSILLLYGFLSVFLIAVLGIGLLISTYSETQQQAMSLAFFVMMIFMLMSGLFTSIESMPDWAIHISRLNPVTYFIEVMRMVVLKGSGFTDIKRHLLVMFGFAALFNIWAVLNYRKRA